MEEEFQPWDRVRIDIPDETDPDYGWHGEHGQVVDVLHDEAGQATGNSRDSALYRIDLEEHDSTLDVRFRDLRPPLDE